MAIRLKLQRGKLIERPNRFIFWADFKGERLRLHCPVTGSIGGVKDFHGIPCLFSPSAAAGRRTAGTVEALSLDRCRSWIGINQNRINGWMEELLRADAMKKMVRCKGAEILHEIREGNSRLDLCVRHEERRTYLELKTPMRDLFFDGDAPLSRPSDPNYFERGIKHFYELARLAGEGNRTIVAICFMYDAQEFRPREQSEWSRRIREAVDHAKGQGVESWQINLKITDRRLSVRSLFRLW
ncbi:MAG: DNA/RNA nuclease SfsA [Puniceicoccales bacterium]|nr:DNA/RNA nuclease SfsA [Puniceicoccales bacterium]